MAMMRAVLIEIITAISLPASRQQHTPESAETCIGGHPYSMRHSKSSVSCEWQFADR
jgi:hypothetical protein